jgi:hypothetical protein
MTDTRLVFDEEKHQYTYDGHIYPSVTEICTPLQSFDVSPAVLQQAQRRGTQVHEYCQLIDYGIEPDALEVEPELAGYVLAYMRFLRDYKPEWDMIEQPLVSTAEHYAGTLDRFGKIDGRPWLMDIKTTSQPKRPTRISWVCQLEGYSRMLECNIYRRADLQLKKDGTYKLYFDDETEEKYSFDAVELFDQLLNINKIMKGET